MDIQTFTFTPRDATINYTVDGHPRDRKWQFGSVPNFRQVVVGIVAELCETHQRTLFAHVCGRCGNSCRRDKILVREQEIFALQSHFGLDENSFRQRHLDQAFTWNPGDAVLRLENGACPFLNSDGSDQPLNAKCKVYDIRPQSCRDFISNASYCRKDMGVIIEELSRLFINKAELRAVACDATEITIPTPPEWWNLLTQAFIAEEGSDPERLDRTTDQIVTMLEGMIEGFGRATLDDDYIELLKNIEKLIATAASMVDMQPSVNTSVDTAWGHLRQLQDLIANRKAGVPAEGKKTALRPENLEWLILGENALAMKVAGRDEPFHLTLEPFVQQAQALLMRILQRPEDNLQHVIHKEDPECLICGECCTAYLVEIYPSDIHRLCELMKIPYADFVTHYTKEARFGWNPHDRILNKKSVPNYTKKLTELRLIGEETKDMCIFLDRRDNGYFLCQVYSHRPYVCRGYQPNHGLCRKTNNLENPGRQAQNMKSVLMTSDTFFVQPNAYPEPLQYPRNQWPEVDAAARALEAAAVNQTQKTAKAQRGRKR